MALEDALPLENVRTWLNDVTSRGAWDIPEQLNLFESNLVKDLDISTLEPGHVVATLKVAPRLVNKYRTLHGGAIASLVDVLGMLAVKTVSTAQKGVTTDVNISYISGAPLLTEVEAEATVLRAGRSLAVASVEIRNKETRVLHVQGRITAYLSTEKFSLRSAKL